MSEALAVVEAQPEEFNRQNYRTPDWLYLSLNRRYGPFQLDAFADDTNTKCRHWLTKKDDALSQRWVVGEIRRVFCNPEYSRGSVARALAHAREEAKEAGAVITLIVPSTRDTEWFHFHVLRGAQVVDNDVIHLGVDTDMVDEPVRRAQLTRYDLVGMYLEIIDPIGRINFHQPLEDGTWGVPPGKSPEAATMIITFISKVKERP